MVTITMYITERLQRDFVPLRDPGIMVRMAESDLNSGIESYVALGDSFTAGLNDYAAGGGLVGWADRLADVMSAQVPEFRYANLAIRGKLLREVMQEQIDPAIA